LLEWLLVLHVLDHWQCIGDLRSGSRLSSFTLEAARALFPPLGSHLGLLKGLLVADWNCGVENAIGHKHILTFA
jgi:hypothetical protein